MTKKSCTNCGLLKPISEFNWRNRRAFLRNTRCNVCTRTVTRAAYYHNQAYYLRRAAERNSQAKKAHQKFLFDYLLCHPCVDCGVSDPVVLQFDHVRGKKRFSVASMVNRRFSLDTIVAEIKKCEVRCANCHARKTARTQNYYAYLKGLD